jgi:hypothetical protein
LLKAGNCSTGLHKAGREYTGETDNTVIDHSTTKIVFEMEEDIHAAIQQLPDKNILTNEVKTFSGYNFFICDGEDPEGNVFQLKQEKK